MPQREGSITGPFGLLLRELFGLSVLPLIRHELAV